MSPDAAESRLKILTFTTLYPNSSKPNHGVFVENRLRHLVAGADVQARVVAPVPWFPFRGGVFGEYAAFARVPRDEQRSGIPVTHPRYPLIPKVGMAVAPLSMYLVLRSGLRRLLRDGYDFDLIDAHYFYPDGVAAALLGRYLRRPVVITARGSDLNVIPRYALPRRMIRWAAREAAGLITVSNSLRDVLAGLGAGASSIRVLRNGVDLEMFRTVDRDEVRRDLRLDRPTLLSVGNLLPLKGHDLVIRALERLGDTVLLVAGDGPEKASLARLTERLGVGDRVRFLESVPHSRMPDIYGAADVLVLASSREGWPNVLLESMACGTPVVASNVSGIPEIVTSPVAGRLLEERTPEAIARAVSRVMADPPERGATRSFAEQFSWEETTRGQYDLFLEVLRQRRG